MTVNNTGQDPFISYTPPERNPLPIQTIAEEGNFDPHAPYTGFSPEPVSRSVGLSSRVRFLRDGERPPPVARRLFASQLSETTSQTTKVDKEEEEGEEISFCKSVMIVAGACLIAITIIKTLDEYLRVRNSSNALSECAIKPFPLGEGYKAVVL